MATKSAATKTVAAKSTARNQVQGRPAGDGGPAKRSRDPGKGWRRDPGCAASSARSLRRRRQEDDQAGQEARLCHLRAAQCRDAVGGGHLREDRRRAGDDERDGHQRRRDRGSRQRRGGTRRAGRGGDRIRRARRGHAQDAGQIRNPRADRAHRRSGAHVFARNGLGRASLPRRRNRHRQANRSRP